MEAAVGNMIYTMFLKHLNFDYSCLGETVIELVWGYTQMACKGEITLEALMHEEIPFTPLDSTPAIIPEAVAIPPTD